MQVAIVTFGLILTRTAAFLATVPLFAGRNLPRTVKVGLAVALASMWFEAFQHSVFERSALADMNLHWFGLALAIVREGITGAVLGFGFGLFLLPTRIAGAYIGQEMGLTMATLTDPSAGESVNVIGQLFESLGVLIFFGLNVHHVMLASLHASFVRWPLGQPVRDLPLLPIMNTVGRAQNTGLLLIAPIAVCLFVAMIMLLVLTKAAPQLNLFSVGLTIRLVVGLVGMLFFLPDLCLLIQTMFHNTSEFFGTVLMS